MSRENTKNCGRRCGGCRWEKETNGWNGGNRCIYEKKKEFCGKKKIFFEQHRTFYSDAPSRS